MSSRPCRAYTNHSTRREEALLALSAEKSGGALVSSNVGRLNNTMKKQKKLGRALKKQKREIERLKTEAFRVLKGFGISNMISFTFSGFQYPDGGIDTQQKIDDGFYKSIEDFDSTHTADVEFIDLYEGKDILKYRDRTRNNLIDLGRTWRERLVIEYPKAGITIIVHKHEDEWFLDTFNYKVEIEEGIYL